MKSIRDFFGYLLGGILFVCLIPTIMWLASGMPALLPVGVARGLLCYHDGASAQRRTPPSPRLRRRIRSVLQAFEKILEIIINGQCATRIRANR